MNYDLHTVAAQHTYTASVSVLDQHYNSYMTQLNDLFIVYAMFIDGSGCRGLDGFQGLPLEPYSRTDHRGSALQQNR